METIPATETPVISPLPGIKSGTQEKETAVKIPIWYRSPWKWLFSLKVGIALLVMLTIASIIGTMIAPLSRAQELVFYTWWYMAMLLALAVNMTCATYKTVVNKLVPTRRLRIHTEKAFYHSENQLSLHIAFSGTPEQVAAAFTQQGFKTKVEGVAGAARTGWFGRFGAPVSHAGLVIVLLAGFASSWMAKEAIIQVPEGRTTTTMQMLTGKKDIVPLGFALTINDFDTGFHPRTRIPSHYISDVTARDSQGRLIYTGPVEVNHSPKINGWRVHQTSYQELENLPRYEVQVASSSVGVTRTVNLSPGQSLLLDESDTYQISMDQRMNWVIRNKGEVMATGSLLGGAGEAKNLSLIAYRFEPDFVLGENRQITSRSNELNNPALMVKLMSDGTPLMAQWIFGREDMRGFSHSSAGDYTMELLDIHRDSTGDSFVVSVTDASSGVVISRAVLTLGEEQPIGKHAAQGHHDHDHHCDSCASAANTAIAGNASNGWDVKLNKRVTAYATVLTLTRNPTIPTIYFGCILMMIGLVMSFALPRRDVWFLIDEKKKKLMVTAKYRHHAEEFDRATSAAIARIKADKES